MYFFPPTRRMPVFHSYHELSLIKCKLGGHGNLLGIRFYIQPLPNLTQEEYSQLSSSIRLVENCHIDPDHLNLDNVKTLIQNIGILKKLIRPQYIGILHRNTVDFLRAVIYSIHIDNTTGPIGLKKFLETQSHIIELCADINTYLERHLDIGDDEKIIYMMPHRNNVQYFQNINLSDFKCYIIPNLNNYRRWQSWEDLINHNEIIIKYLNDIYAQIDTTLNANECIKLARKIKHFTTELANWSNRNLPNRNLECISLLRELATKCEDLSPVSPTKTVESMLNEAYSLANTEQFPQEFDEFKIVLGDCLKNKQEEERVKFMQKCYNHVAHVFNDSHHGVILKEYIERTLNNTRVGIPLEIYRRIQEMRNSYDIPNATTRQLLKLTFLNKLCAKIRENPHRSSRTWFKLVYKDIASHEDNLALIRMLNEPYKISLFENHRFKELLSFLKNNENRDQYNHDECNDLNPSLM